MLNFCTYFDTNYAEKGWVCYHTLIKQNSNIMLYLLALDQNVYNQAFNKKNVTVISLSEIENFCPELLKIKDQRQLKEYYATISPILPLYIFDKYRVNKVYYTDADMAFWSDPQEIDNIMNNYSLMVCDHGFEPPRCKIRFNVGILGYSNDYNCIEFLKWWKDKCIEWCFWITLPDGRMGEQGYLNILHDDPNKFKNVLSCPQPGVNFGPWSFGLHSLSKQNDKILVDKKYNLVTFHYHEFRKINDNLYYPTGWKHSLKDKELIYDPYFNIMRNL
jgi:hypothetical protein